jgi:hypothetical protein
MKLSEFKETISSGKLICPSCGKAIRQFDKFIEEAISSIWDGFGDSRIEMGGSKVTLICGNPGCAWRERTEYWTNYLQ